MYQEILTEISTKCGSPRGWQTALANEIGVTPAYICGLANGRINPSKPVAKMLELVRERGLVVPKRTRTVRASAPRKSRLADVSTDALLRELKRRAA